MQRMGACGPASLPACAGSNGKTVERHMPKVRMTKTALLASTVLAGGVDHAMPCHSPLPMQRLTMCTHPARLCTAPCMRPTHAALQQRAMDRNHILIIFSLFTSALQLPIVVMRYMGSHPLVGAWMHGAWSSV